MIKAKFIGQDSMGFIHDRVYDLNTRIQEFQMYGFCLVVYDQNSSAYCPYGSLEAFLNNWQVISTCKPSVVFKERHSKQKTCFTLPKILHLRSAPEIIGRRVYSLGRDSKCIVLEEMGNWWRIKSLEDENIIGWVQKRNVTTYQF